MKYKDKKGRIVTVVKLENNIAQLNNGERVAIQRLNDERFYTQIDSNVNSTSSSTTSINESISNDIFDSTNRYKKMIENKTVSIGEDNDEILRPTQRTIYNQQSDIKISSSVVESHTNRDGSSNSNIVEKHKPHIPENTVVSNLSPEEKLLAKYGHNKNETTHQSNKLEKLAYGEEYTKPYISDDIISESNNIIETEKTNPIFQIFDKAKKTHSLNVTLKIKEKIPSKDIIKMLEDNFEDSAIDYYASDIFRKLMEDPTVIENQIKEAINKYLKTKPRKPRKK